MPRGVPSVKAVQAMQAKLSATDCLPADDLWALTRAYCTPAGARGLAVEAFWFSTHALLYPFGAMGDLLIADDPIAASTLRPDDLVPGAVAGTGTPIVLVHGIGDNRSAFAVLRRALARRRLGPVLLFDYSPTVVDLRRVAADLGRAIADLRERTGVDQVDIVGHSLGGLIARYYAQVGGGAPYVRSLVTLGAPHGGTSLAQAVPHPIASQLRPGSSLLRALAAPVPGFAPSVTAIYSTLDQIVLPAAAGRLDHPDIAAHNICLDGVGHWSLPMDPRALSHVLAALAEPPTP